MEETLNNLVKEYISKELKYNPPPEKESSASQSSERSGLQRRRGKGNLLPTSADQEYIDALQECLENKGILREMQTFLRQRLVLVLQEKWPNLSTSSPSLLINPAVVKLIQDFLCCRKLLYTFSVMASEIGVTYSSTVKFGKLPGVEAEQLLEEFDIKKDTRLSQRILKIYSDRESTSLLECLVHALSWYCDEVPPALCPTPAINAPLFNGTRKTRDKKETGTNEGEQSTNAPIATSGQRFVLSKSRDNMSMEERLIALQRELEESKDLQLQREIKRFKETEIAKIKDELQTEMRFELMAKENELLQHYNAKYDTMKEDFEKEKAAWFARTEKECEIRLTQKMSMGNREHDSFIESSNECQNLGRESVKTPPKSTKGTMTALDEANEETESTSSRRMIESIPSKETRLRGSIFKLQEENKRIAGERDYYASRSREELEESSPRPKVSTVDCDTIAFLKYNLERQSDEITELKRRMFLDTHQDSSQAQSVPKVSSGPSGKSAPHPKEKTVDSDLLNFLAESKQRCIQIEQESKSIENKIQELKYRRSRPSTPVAISKQSTIFKPSMSEGNNCDISDIPYSVMSKHLLTHLQLNPPLPPLSQPVLQPSMILKRPLLEWNQREVEVQPATNNSSSLMLPGIPRNVSMHTVLDRKNEFMEKQSYYDRKISADLNALTSLSRQQLPSFPEIGLSQIPSSHEQQSRVTLSTEPRTVSSTNIAAVSTVPSVVMSAVTAESNEVINEFQNSPTRKPSTWKVVASSSQENSPLSIAEVRRSEESSSQVKKAVKQGALSFEKFTSEDEISQRSSASQKQFSSKLRNSGENSRKAKDKSPPPTEKLDENVQKSSESDFGATVDPKFLADSHEKYAMKKITKEEEFENNNRSNKSVSFSAPSEESDSADADSDFWKM